MLAMQDRERLRKGVIELILATDMKHHCETTDIVCLANAPAFCLHTCVLKPCLCWRAPACNTMFVCGADCKGCIIGHCTYLLTCDRHVISRLKFVVCCVSAALQVHSPHSLPR